MTCLEGHRPRAWEKILALHKHMVLLKRWDIQTPQVQASLHDMTPGRTDTARAIAYEKRRILEDWSSWRSLLGGGTLMRNPREREEKEGRRLSSQSCVDPTIWVSFIYTHSTGSSPAPGHSTPTRTQHINIASYLLQFCLLQKYNIIVANFLPYPLTLPPQSKHPKVEAIYSQVCFLPFLLMLHKPYGILVGIMHIHRFISFCKLPFSPHCSLFFRFVLDTWRYSSFL